MIVLYLFQDVDPTERQLCVGSWLGMNAFFILFDICYFFIVLYWFVSGTVIVLVRILLQIFVLAYENSLDREIMVAEVDVLVAKRKERSRAIENGTV